jgi:hypothetical protein
MFLASWIYLFSKTVKIWPHLFRYPADVKYYFHHIAFGYFHGLIKLYGGLTLSDVCASDKLNLMEVSLTAFSSDNLGKQRWR